MILFFKMLSLLPLQVLHPLGWVLGWLAFAGSPAYRQRFVANARQAGVGRWQMLQAVGHSGQMVAELPRLWLGAPVPVQWVGDQHIASALARGRGLVFLTPHLGCFEVTAQAYARRFGASGAPMTVLFRPPRQRWLAEVVRLARVRPGLQTAPTALSGVKQLIKALRCAEAVGLLPDQVPPEGMGVEAPFFGRAAYTMTLSVRLVQQTGAGVLLAWGERLSWGRGYRVHVQTVSEALPSDLPQAVAQVNRWMQSLIQQRPGQYLWGYARYKRPRAPES